MTDDDAQRRTAQPTRLLPLFELNPDYGTGAFRRRIRLRHRSGGVAGVLDDNNHALWLRLRHAGGHVTEIEGGFNRWPTTGCGGAPAVLQELVGIPITAPQSDLLGGGRARRHCTHLYDLALLALSMANRAEGDRVWDAIVPDPQDGRTTATLTLDGLPLHSWMVEGQVIRCAHDEAPQSLLTGFTAWASRRFAGDALAGATVLRMAAFTARARAHIPDDRPWPLASFPEREGACFAYSQPQLAAAVHRQDVVRDFSVALSETRLPDP